MKWLKKAPGPLLWIAVPALTYTLAMIVLANLISKDILNYGWSTWWGTALVAIIVLTFTVSIYMDRLDDTPQTAISALIPWVVYSGFSLLYMLVKGQVLWPPLLGFEIAILTSFFVPVLYGVHRIRTARA